MKVNLIIVPRPTSHAHTLFAEINKDLLRETKTVTVRANTVSKTRVSTSMQIGDACNNINFAIDGFKSDRVEDWNYFSGRTSVHNYFKLSKKQGLTEYREYVKKAVVKALTEYLNMGMDEVTIELNEPTFN